MLWVVVLAEHGGPQGPESMASTSGYLKAGAQCLEFRFVIFLNGASFPPFPQLEMLLQAGRV